VAETTLTVINAARSARWMPDGSPMPTSLAHALLVLATYYPHIWPAQHRLADDMSVSRSNVNKRLRRLEDAGLITRFHRGRAISTVYRLNLRVVRKCGACPTGDAGIPNLGEIDPKVSEDDDWEEGF
jgi:biotin operon repressor